MTDELAAACGRDVPRETLQLLERFQALVEFEAGRQNLVSQATLPEFHQRHLLDSAQLVRLATPGQHWLDVGSGAGLPGMVIGIITGDPITLVEPRRLRADFLQRCVDELCLPDVLVIAAKVERAEGQYDVITARAVASLDVVLGLTYRLSHERTRWVLPKGRSAARELAEVEGKWQGRFAMVPSITDEDAAIVVVEQLRPKSGAGDRAAR